MPVSSPKAVFHMELEGWHPRDDRPMTQAKADQIAESASPLIHWLGDILENGVLPYRIRDQAGMMPDVVHEEDPALARADQLRIHAAAHLGRRIRPRLNGLD